MGWWGQGGVIQDMRTVFSAPPASCTRPAPRHVPIRLVDKSLGHGSATAAPNGNVPEPIVLGLPITFAALALGTP